MGFFEGLLTRQCDLSGDLFTHFQTEWVFSSDNSEKMRLTGIFKIRTLSVPKIRRSRSFVLLWRRGKPPAAAGGEGAVHAAIVGRVRAAAVASASLALIRRHRRRREGKPARQAVAPRIETRTRCVHTTGERGITERMRLSNFSQRGRIRFVPPLAPA